MLSFLAANWGWLAFGFVVFSTVGIMFLKGASRPYNLNQDDTDEYGC